MKYAKRLSALFAVVLWAGLAGHPARAQNNEDANLLFGQALALHADAEAASGQDRLQTLRRLQDILDRIKTQYPDSIPGQRLLAGGELGPIVPADIAFELAASLAGPAGTDRDADAAEAPAPSAAYCQSPGLLLEGGDVAATLLGARMQIEVAGGVRGRYYLTRRGDRRARALIVFDGKSAAQVAGDVTIESNALCLTADGSDQRVCDLVRHCRDAGGPAYLLESEDGHFSAKLSALELSGSELSREVSAVRGGSLTEDMTGWDYKLFVPCIFDQKPGLYSHDCLVAQGMTPDIAERYIDLAREMNDNVIVQAVRSFGDVQLVDMMHPTYANSNDQQYILRGGKKVALDYSPVSRGFERPTDVEARRIKRAYPKAFVDWGRGNISYFRLDGGTPVVYQTFFLVDACRACERVGAVVVETRVTGNTARSQAINWTFLKPGEWRAPGPEIDDIQRFLSDNPKKLQASLKNAGYKPGPIDGVVGARTKAALRAFQHEHCIDPAVGLNQTSARALWERWNLWGGCHET